MAMPAPRFAYSKFASFLSCHFAYSNTIQALENPTYCAAFLNLGVFVGKTILPQPGGVREPR